MRIAVEQRDIQGSVRCSSGRCPVARAILRQVECMNVSVSPHVAHIQTEFGQWFRCPFTKSVQKRIEAYDERKPMKPFSFPLVMNPVTV